MEEIWGCKKAFTTALRARRCYQRLDERMTSRHAVHHSTSVDYGKHQQRAFEAVAHGDPPVRCAREAARPPRRNGMSLLGAGPIAPMLGGAGAVGPQPRGPWQGRQSK
jgi:hypothetical protein